MKDAGLGSLPGGGGEILVDRVRKEITRGKVLTDGWLDVHRAWHELGGISTATMMYGHVETLEERIEHMERVRQLQDETGGLTAFISWTFQPEHTDMADVPAAGAFEYLRTQAVSRLYLDNVPNIQSSWVTQGPKIGQLALYFGANDMGSLMIEENVVASAGTVYYLSLEQIKRAIRESGYIPRQRNVFYEYIDAEPTEPQNRPLRWLVRRLRVPYPHRPFLPRRASVQREAGSRGRSSPPSRTSFFRASTRTSVERIKHVDRFQIRINQPDRPDARFEVDPNFRQDFPGRVVLTDQFRRPGPGRDSRADLLGDRRVSRPLFMGDEGQVGAVNCVVGLIRNRISMIARPNLASRTNGPR